MRGEDATFANLKAGQRRVGGKSLGEAHEAGHTIKWFEYLEGGPFAA